MKRTTISRVTEAKMSLRLYGRYFNRFFKYAPDSLSAIKCVDTNLDFLSSELYSLPDELLFNKDNEFVGYYSKYLNGYRTLYECIKGDVPFDKGMVAGNIMRIVEELELIGLNYFDLHDENFMVNKKGEFKVIDVDGVDFDMSSRSKIDRINNLWDLLLEIYLFESNPNHPLRLNSVALFEELDTYFSDEFVEYLDGVLRDDWDILNVNPRKYLPEFNDEEKVKELSKRIELEGRRYGC